MSPNIVEYELSGKLSHVFVRLVIWSYEIIYYFRYFLLTREKSPLLSSFPFTHGKMFSCMMLCKSNNIFGH